jgi:hypothetical protein
MNDGNEIALAGLSVLVVDDEGMLRRLSVLRAARGTDVIGADTLTGARHQVTSVLTPVDFLGHKCSLVVSSNGATSTYELFLFGGQPDQFFQFQSSTNLTAWQTNAVLELFDASGTIYLLRTRDLTNTPPTEVYRTRLMP